MKILIFIHLRYLGLASTGTTIVLHHINPIREAVVRALFFSIIVSSVLVSPMACGGSLQPGPFGSAPTSKSFILTFDGSAGTRASYVVDSRGYFWPTTPTVRSTQIAGLAANDDTSNKGLFLPGLSANVFNSRGVSGGTGGLSNLFSSGGDEINSLWASKGLGESSNFGAANNRSGFLGLLSDSGSTGLDAEGIRGAAPSVSTTPLPSSWTMMLIGLLLFGLHAWFRKPKMPENRPHPGSLAAE